MANTQIIKAVHNIIILNYFLAKIQQKLLKVNIFLLSINKF